ncbi:MAG: hypothetical protein JWM21_4258 [Acidobacteria bacterium]|nr:hypothetical protein [Acidobacteriota bacterium]
MIKTILITCCLLSMFLLACSKTETTTPTSSATPATKAPAASTPSGAATASTTAGKVGVAECDAFIEAYENCVNNKVPATMRPQFNAGLASWRKQWHDLAANPQTKPTLVQVCKTQLETAKTSMKAYGCAF